MVPSLFIVFPPIYPPFNKAIIYTIIPWVTNNYIRWRRVTNYISLYPLLCHHVTTNTYPVTANNTADTSHSISRNIVCVVFQIGLNHQHYDRMIFKKKLSIWGKILFFVLMKIGNDTLTAVQITLTIDYSNVL